MAGEFNTISSDDVYKLEMVDGPVNYIGNPNGTPERRRFNGPIHHAALNFHDNNSTMEMLLDKGANINRIARNKMTALHCAALMGNIKIANTLLDRGIDQSLLDEEELTALHCAACEVRDDPTESCIQNRISMVELLLSKKFDVNAQTTDGYTPLMFAVKEFGDKRIIKVLLKAGADLHRRTPDNETCLHILLSGPGKTNMMIELIKAGASIHDQDCGGKDAIDRLVESDNHTIDQKAEKLKELIKVTTLVHYTEKVDFQIDRIIRYRLGRFADECYAEVQKMRSIALSRRSTLCDFAIHGEKSLRIVDKVFEKLMVQDFVIYCDYLAASFERNYLIHKIFEKGIYSVNNLMVITFPYILIPNFCMPLSNEDLLNLLKVLVNSSCAYL